MVRIKRHDGIDDWASRGICNGHEYSRLGVVRTGEKSSLGTGQERGMLKLQAPKDNRLCKNDRIGRFATSLAVKCN